jgi:hypothetical protein
VTQANRSWPGSVAPVIPLSNRRGITSKIEDPALGLDKLSVGYRVPLYGFDRESRDWASRTQYRDGRETFGTVVDVAPGVSAFVGVQVRPELPFASVKIEGNPCRLVDPGGWGLAGGPRAAERLVLAALAVVGGELVSLPVCPVSEFSVTRADIARDFAEVERPGELIRALASVHRPWARLNLVHADASRNRAQTLMVGSKTSFLVRLYDKHTESEGAAPAGTVRWEVEGKRSLLQRADIRVLGDLTEERMGAVARERWDWSGMGREVICGMPALLDRLSGRPLVLATGCGVRETSGNEIDRPAGVSLSAAQCRGFIGYLAYKACGVESDIGSETLAKYRRVEREYGIVAADLFGGEAGLQVIGRLDFETGREVLRVA